MSQPERTQACVDLLSDCSFYCAGEESVLELAGPLLALHAQGRGLVNSVYFPAQSVDVQTRRRWTLPGTLFAAALGLVAFAAGVSFISRLVQTGVADVVPVIASMARPLASVGPVFGLGILVGLVFLIAKPETVLPRRRTASFNIRTEDGTARIEFWYGRGRDCSLDLILDAAQEQARPDGPSIPAVVHIQHDWRIRLAEDVAAASALLSPVPVGCTAIGCVTALPGALLALIRGSRTGTRAAEAARPAILFEIETKRHIAALDLLVERKYAKAERTVRPILNANPDDPHALFILACVYIQMARFDEAAVCAKRLEEGGHAIQPGLAEKVRWLESWHRGETVSDPGQTPEHRQRKQLVGKTGQAKTALRPCGRVSIDDDTFEARAEGEHVAVGQNIQVTGQDGFSLIVRSTAEQGTDEPSRPLVRDRAPKE